MLSFILTATPWRGEMWEARSSWVPGVKKLRSSVELKALASLPRDGEKVLILGAVQKAVQKAGRTGKARSHHLKKVVDEIASRVEKSGEGAVRLGSQIGITKCNYLRGNDVRL